MNAAPKTLDDCDELYDVMHYLEHVFSNDIDGSSGIGLLGDIIPFDDTAVFVHLLSARKAGERFRDFPEMPYDRIYDMNRDDAAAFQSSLTPSRLREVFDRARQLEAAIKAAQKTMVSAIRNRLNGLKLDYGSDLGPENLGPTWHRLAVDYSTLSHLIPDLIEAVGDQERRHWREVRGKILDAVVAFRESYDWDRIMAQGLEAPTLIGRARGPEFQAHLEHVKGLLSTASSTLEPFREGLMVRVAEALDYSLEDYFEFDSEEEAGELLSVGSPSRT